MTSSFPLSERRSSTEEKFQYNKNPTRLPINTPIMKNITQSRPQLKNTLGQVLSRNVSQSVYLKNDAIKKYCQPLGSLENELKRTVSINNFEGNKIQNTVHSHNKRSKREVSKNYKINKIANSKQNANAPDGPLLCVEKCPPLQNLNILSQVKSSSLTNNYLFTNEVSSHFSADKCNSARFEREFLSLFPKTNLKNVLHLNGQHSNALKTCRPPSSKSQISNYSNGDFSISNKLNGEHGLNQGNVNFNRSSQIQGTHLLGDQNECDNFLGQSNLISIPKIERKYNFLGVEIIDPNKYIAEYESELFNSSDLSELEITQWANSCIVKRHKPVQNHLETQSAFRPFHSLNLYEEPKMQKCNYSNKDVLKRNKNFNIKIERSRPIQPTQMFSNQSKNKKVLNKSNAKSVPRIERNYKFLGVEKFDPNKYLVEYESELFNSSELPDLDITQWASSEIALPHNLKLASKKLCNIII